jgi:hypothetical protein
MRIALSWLLLFLMTLSKPAYSLSLAPGLTYSQFKCISNETEIEFMEIQLRPQSKLQLKVIPNPSAVVDSHCLGNYGGKDLSQIISQYDSKKSSFQPLAVVNGNFFHTQPKAKGKTGYAPNGLLWSRSNTPGGDLITPFRLRGGKDLLIVDSNGASRVSLVLEVCGNQTCASLAHPEELKTPQRKFFSKKMKTPDFVKAVGQAFPQLSFLAQLSMDLTGGHLDSSKKLIHYSQCEDLKPGQNPKVDDDRKNFWKCRDVPRTLFCGRKDGRVSFLVTPSAYVYDLAVGLRVGGSCKTECAILFNLDGGGSTQLGYRNPKNKKFIIPGIPESDPTTPSSEVDRCGKIRPVDHYFAIGNTFP